MASLILKGFGVPQRIITKGFLFNPDIVVNYFYHRNNFYVVTKQRLPLYVFPEILNNFFVDVDSTDEILAINMYIYIENRNNLYVTEVVYHGE